MPDQGATFAKSRKESFQAVPFTLRKESFQAVPFTPSPPFTPLHPRMEKGTPWRAGRDRSFAACLVRGLDRSEIPDSRSVPVRTI